MKRKPFSPMFVFSFSILILALIACRGGNGNESGGNHENVGIAAADWIFVGTTGNGHIYYDKNGIQVAGQNIIRVETKKLLTDAGETGKNGNAPSLHQVASGDDASFIAIMNEFDCANKKIRPLYSNSKYKNKSGDEFFTIKYDNWDNISPRSAIRYDQWHDVVPGSVAEKLTDVVCKKSSPAAAPATAEKSASVAAAPVVPPGKTTPITENKPKIKSNAHQEIEALINQWLKSWQSHDMGTFRNCYANDFQSKGRNLNTYISDKTNVLKKSENLNIKIDNLQISVDENKAEATFTQHYSSSVFKYSGKKTLELKKINNAWKIYKEFM